VKNDLPYFPHDNDARNHAKMMALRARYGWTGYGQFWALNEMVAGAGCARLDLSRKVVKAGAACELGMTPDALEDFLLFLSDPEECGLIHYENGMITTDRTQESYQQVKAERERKRDKGTKGAEKHWNGAEESQNGAEKNSKGKERKEEKRKEEGGARARDTTTPSEFLAKACEAWRNGIAAEAGVPPESIPVDVHTFDGSEVPEENGLDAIAFYFTHWRRYWFAVKKGDMKLVEAKRLPDFNPRLFMKNIQSILVDLAVNESARAQAGPWTSGGEPETATDPDALAAAIRKLAEAKRYKVRGGQDGRNNSPGIVEA